MQTPQLLSRRDLDFMLDEWLDVVRLTERPPFKEHSAETFSAVLDLSESIAINEFAPHNRASDLQEPRLREDGTVELIPEVAAALAAYRRSGLPAATFDVSLGGMRLPATVHRASALWLSAANFSTTGYAFLAAAAANLLVAHAEEDLVDRFARPMIEGRFFGTMCLSEPQAGSSLADIRTRAVRQGDGTYRLRGTKMWISAGDHELGENIVHLVLARTGELSAGVKGISLFAVPKYLVGAEGTIGERNDVVLVGLNHKMGNRGTTNAVLGFGEGTHSPAGKTGALGYLVGAEGGGLACMFHMMNEARIAVGAGAVALGYAGYLRSLSYARTREQGRRLTDPSPMSPPVPLSEHADVRRMLLAQKAYVEGGMALVLYCARLVDECASAPLTQDRERAATLLDLLTPIAKSFPSQWCLAANDLAIQILGGYGYTRDFEVEQHYRDNRLNPIHEGTHGIQGLGLLGRQVRARQGAGLRTLVEEISRATDAAAQLTEELDEFAGCLRARADRLVETTDALWASGDPEVALANSSIYLEAAGHIVVAWMWLEQVIVASGRSGSFYEGKRAAARYFFRYELPRVDVQLDLLNTLDRTTLDLDPDCL